MSARSCKENAMKGENRAGKSAPARFNELAHDGARYSQYSLARPTSKLDVNGN